MSIFKKIKNRLRKLFTRRFSEKEKPFDSVTGQFLSVDRDVIANKLNLKERAEKDGINNIPASDTKTKDSATTEIDAELMEILRTGKDDFQNYLLARDDLDTGQSVDIASEIKGTTKKVATTLRSKCKDGQNTLYTQKQNVSDGELALEKFREENRLERPGESLDNFYQIWWVVFFAMLEVFLNAWALGDVHPGGWFGALPEIFSIVIINVALGFFVGFYFWRKTNHINRPVAYLGYIMTTTFFLFVVLFNFVVGHYRDALMGLETTSGDLLRIYGSLLSTAVDQAFSWETFIPGSLMSMLMIFIGIIIFFSAAWKSNAADDPYPGYGGKCRDHNKRKEDYATLFSDLQKELEKVGDEARGNIAGISEGRYDSIERSKSVLVSQYYAWLSEVESIGAFLYTTYRQINKQYRTKASPLAFEIGFSIPDSLKQLPADLVLQVEKQDPQHLQKLKDECLNIINLAINEYLAVYKGISELAPKDAKAKRASAYSTEVEEINAKHQKRISGLK